MTTLMSRALDCVLLAACLEAASAASTADDAGFQPIFNGTSLDGWLGQDMSFWSVEDGAITGTISPEHAPPMNQYLVWQQDTGRRFRAEARLSPDRLDDTQHQRRVSIPQPPAAQWGRGRIPGRQQFRPALESAAVRRVRAARPGAGR